MPGELPLVLLSLLAERPQSGYVLLGELGRRFGPAYKPSPGSVYPALTALRAESLIEDRDGTNAPTADGRRLLEAERHRLADIEVRTSASLAGPVGIDRLLERFAARVAALGGRVDRTAVERILDDAALAIAALEQPHGT